MAGALAGLGCALKPRYCAVFAVLECLALTRGLRPWRIMPLAAGTTLIGYAGLVAIVCPAYLRHAVPMALALYGATDVPFLTLLADSAMLLGGLAVAAGLLWLRRRSLTDYSLMLTLVVFAATSTVVCFVDGKDWYYHRLPATVATVLALLLWTATELVQRRWRIRWPLAVAGLAVIVFCVSSIRQLEPEAVDAVEPRQTAVDRLEHIIRAEHARTYIAFSEWIALGFPVVNETGVTWASRFEFDVGVEGRGLAGRLRSGGGQGMADRPLGGARFHRRLPRHRGGRYPRDDQVHQGSERGRSRIRTGLVPLPADRDLSTAWWFTGGARQVAWMSGSRPRQSR